MSGLRKAKIPVLSIPELQRILEPLVPELRRIVWPVVDQYKAHVALAGRNLLSASCRAHVLNCYMVANARGEFGGREGFHLINDQNGSLLLGIDGLQYHVAGTVVCRFKKLDDENRSSNAATKRILSLRNNESLPGLPSDATYVDIGYVLNDLEDAIAAAHAVRLTDCREILEIPNTEDRVVPMPGSLPDLGGPSGTSRFRIIRPQRDREGGGEGSGS